jgi:hypothetical protein
MWSKNLDFMVSVMIFGLTATLVRALYQARHSPAAATSPELVAATVAKPAPDESARPEDLRSQQKEWAKQAVQKYAAAQEKKWRRWNESMFEPQ